MENTTTTQTRFEKQIQIHDGGRICSMAVEATLGVTVRNPIWSIGCSCEGDGPKIGDIFNWRGQDFVVCTLGTQNWQGRSAFTGLAVA